MFFHSRYSSFLSLSARDEDDWKGKRDSSPQVVVFFISDTRTFHLCPPSVYSSNRTKTRRERDIHETEWRRSNQARNERRWMCSSTKKKTERRRIDWLNWMKYNVGQCSMKTMTNSLTKKIELEQGGARWKLKMTIGIWTRWSVQPSFSLSVSHRKIYCAKWEDKALSSSSSSSFFFLSAFDLLLQGTSLLSARDPSQVFVCFQSFHVRC